MKREDEVHNAGHKGVGHCKPKYKSDIRHSTQWNAHPGKQDLGVNNVYFVLHAEYDGKGNEYIDALKTAGGGWISGFLTKSLFIKHL